ncbi:hypothetical protein CA951_33585 [Rhodococcus sp. NCIMB 12038]|nr:hypothetical protein CA951_33585 [Rhodococcus sp. NCIMB 12038]
MDPPGGERHGLPRRAPPRRRRPHPRNAVAGNVGLTVESNLACLCRRHHRLKTYGCWTVRQIGAGQLE